MANVPRLTETELDSALTQLPLWKREGNAIERDYVFPDFRSAVGFVNVVADLAERADHHPDILIHGWNKVRVTLSTHSANGITANDIALAKVIEDTH